MPRTYAHVTLLDRLRRSSALRVVLLIAAMLASQQSMACAFEEALSPQGTEIVADNGAEECCPLCGDCTQCGGCHASAVSPRAILAQSSFQLNLFAKLTPATAAPKSWAPPALLRPPINAA